MNDSQNAVSGADWQPNNPSLDNEVYRFLVTYYMYQDKLSWSRTQTLVAVEGGVLTASFVKGRLIAIISLLIGSAIVWLIWRLIQRDWEIRNHNLSILDKIHEPKGIRMTNEPRSKMMTGRIISRWIIYLILILNGFFLVIFVLHRAGFNSIKLECLFGLPH